MKMDDLGVPPFFGNIHMDPYNGLYYNPHKPG